MFKPGRFGQAFFLAFLPLNPAWGLDSTRLDNGLRIPLARFLWCRQNLVES